MMRSMQLQMRVDGLFPPGSYKVMTTKCNYRRRLLRAMAAGGAEHPAGAGRCYWDPHALKRRMRLRAIWAARCGKNKSAADAVSTPGSYEGPPGDEVPRAFPGELAVGPASCGCWPVPAAERVGEEHVDLRSVLQKFDLPGQGPSFSFADGEGSVVADGGQSFLMDETIQDMPFAGSFVVASKNADQDPQRAKTCCDGRPIPGLLETRPAQGQKVAVDGLLPQEKFETRPVKGPRSHEVSYLNPTPDGALTDSPQRAPFHPPASQRASHGFALMPVCLGLCAEDFAFDGHWSEADPEIQTRLQDCVVPDPSLGFSASLPLGGLQVCAPEAISDWNGGPCTCCPGLLAEVCAFSAAAPVSAVLHDDPVRLHAVVPEGFAGLAWSKDPGKSSAVSGHRCAESDVSEIGHAYPARLHTECFVGLAGQARSEDPSKSSANSGHRSAASDINAGCCSSCPGLLGELLDGAWPDPSLGFSASAPLGGFVALCHCFTSFAEHSAWGCPGLLGETLDERNNDCDARASLAPTLGFSASSSLGGLQAGAHGADDTWREGFLVRCPGLIAEACAFEAEVNTSVIPHADNVGLHTVSQNGFAGLAWSKDPGISSADFGHRSAVFDASGTDYDDPARLHAVVHEGFAGPAWSKEPGKSSAVLGHRCAESDVCEIDLANPARLHTDCFVGLAGQARSEDPSKSSADSGHRSAESIHAGCCSSCPGLLGELIDGAWPDPTLGFSASFPLGGLVALCHCSTSFATHSARGCPGLLGETLDESNNDCAAGAFPAPTLGFRASSSLGGFLDCTHEADDTWRESFLVCCPGLIAEACAFGAEVATSVFDASGAVYDDPARLHTGWLLGFAGRAWSEDPCKSSAESGFRSAFSDIDVTFRDVPARLHTGRSVSFAGQAWSQDPSTSSADLGHRSAESTASDVFRNVFARLQTGCFVGFAGQVWSEDPSKSSADQGPGSAESSVSTVFRHVFARLHTAVLHGFAGLAWSKDPRTSSANQGLSSAVPASGPRCVQSHGSCTSGCAAPSACACHLLASAACWLCSCSLAPLSRLQGLSHDATKGTRIGEASNPGPGPKILQQLLGGLDIKSLLRDLLKQLLQEVASGQGGAGLLAAINQKPRKRKKKQRNKLSRALGGSGATPSAEPRTPAPSAPGPKGEGKDKGKGKGRGSGKGGGKGNPPPQPNGGPRRPTAEPSPGDGWTPVVRKQRSLGDFVLRAQDWNSPIFKPSELGAKLDGLADGDTLRGIMLVQSDDEFASISGVLRGCPKPHRMLLLRPSNEEGSQRVPGQVGDRLTFRNLAVATFCSSNSSGDMPQFQGSSGSDAKPLKVKITESAVLYVRLSKLYCDPKLWASFERAAAKEALQWAACRHVQALDSFSWSREKGKTGDSEQFFGLLRVAKKDIGPLLSSSGQQGVFVSAPRGLPDAAACEVTWVDRAQKEKPKDYLERVTRMSSAHGLALSNLRLGWRRPLDKDEVPVRVWNVTDVPREWDHCAVADLLGTAFVDPVILSHRWAKRAVTYRFKAKVKAGGDRDVVPLICEHLGANVTLWASLAPPRKQSTFVKPVYTHSVPVVKAADTPEIPTETVAVPTAKTQDADGKDQSQSKQAKQEVRQFPSDLKLVDCPRDGNCILHAFSKALDQTLP